MGAALCQNVLRQNVLERQNNWTAAFQWRSGAHLSLCNLNTVFVNATFKYYAYFLLLFVFASVLRNMNTMNDISQTKCNVSLKAFVMLMKALSRVCEGILWTNKIRPQKSNKIYRTIHSTWHSWKIRYVCVFPADTLTKRWGMHCTHWLNWVIWSLSPCPPSLHYQMWVTLPTAARCVWSVLH